MSKCTILVVDDEERIRKVLFDFFSKNDFNVNTISLKALSFLPEKNVSSVKTTKSIGGILAKNIFTFFNIICS